MQDVVILILTEEDFYNSKYNTRDWEQSVKIERWEHDCIGKTIKIWFTEKC